MNNNILIFKTNISSEEERSRIGAALDACEGIQRWNVDLKDNDFVLRIDTPSLCSEHIIELVTAQGYECCELE